MRLPVSTIRRNHRSGGEELILSPSHGLLSVGFVFSLEHLLTVHYYDALMASASIAATAEHFNFGQLFVRH